VPVAHPGRARAVGHPVRLGRHRDVGQDLPAGQLAAGHRAGVVVGHPQRPATDGEALRAGAGPDRPARQPVGPLVDPGHAVAATTGVGHPDGPRCGRDVQRRPTDRDGRHRAAGRQVDMGDRVLVGRAEVPRGRQWRPTASDRRRRWRRRRGGTRSGLPTTVLVAGSIRTTVPEASTQSIPSATVMLAAPGPDDRGEPAAVEGGHGGAGGRGWRPPRTPATALSRAGPGTGHSLSRAWTGGRRPSAGPNDLVGGPAGPFGPLAVARSPHPRRTSPVVRRPRSASHHRRRRHALWPWSRHAASRPTAGRLRLRLGASRPSLVHLTTTIEAVRPPNSGAAD
jgi:hypothetical protein